jgi:hypothetical protein
MVIHEILPFCIYQARPRNNSHRHERCHDVQLTVCQTSSQVSQVQFLETHVYAEVAASTFESGKGGGIYSLHPNTHPTPLPKRNQFLLQSPILTPILQ